MSDAQRLLNEILGGSQEPLDEGLSSFKQYRIAQETEAKKAKIAGAPVNPIHDGYLDGARAENGVPTSIERDPNYLLRDESILDTSMRSNARAKFRNDSRARRTAKQLLLDGARGVIGTFDAGLGNLAGGAAQVVGAGARAAGFDGVAATADRVTQSIDEGIRQQALQREALRSGPGIQSERAYSARKEVSDQVNQAKYQEDLRKGSPTMAKLNKIGREAVSTLSNLSGENVFDVVTQAGGSLALGAGAGAVAKAGINAVAKGAVASGLVSPFSRTAGKVFDAAEAARMPLVIAAQEGSGALFQTFDEMIANGYSPDEAMEAGRKAGLSQAVIAGILGKITGVGKFESNPLGNVIPRAASRDAARRAVIDTLADPIRETVEETGQSISGQLISNLAQSEFNPDKDIADGIGEQAAMGAVGGFGSAVGAKGVAVPLSAATTAASLAGQAAVATVPAGIRAMDRGIEYAKTAAEDLRTARDFAADKGVTTANIVKAAKASGLMALGAAKAVRNAINPENKERVTSFLATLGDQAASARDRLRAAIALKREVPTADVDVGKAVDAAEEDLKNIDPTNQADVADVLDVAETAPDKIDPDTAGKIIYHIERGDVEATPEQKRALEGARALREAVDEHKAETAEAGLKAKDIVSQEIRVESGNLGKSKALSVLEHRNNILSAVSQGDTEGAKRNLAGLMKFATLMNNKVAALNESYDNGGTGVHYIDPTRGNAKRRSAESLTVHRESRNSIAFAQQVRADAAAVNKIANSLATLYPELEISPLVPTKLHADLNGKSEEIALRNREARRVQTTKPVAAPVSAAPTSSEGGDQSTANEDKGREEKVDSKPTSPPAKAEASPAASEASSKEEGKAERLEQKKAARTKLAETTKPGQLKATRPLKSEPDHFFYRYVTKDGKAVDGLYLYDDAKQEIHSLDIGDTRNPSDIGNADIADLLGKILEKHPEAKTLQAYRHTGARSKPQLITFNEKRVQAFRDRQARKEENSSEPTVDAEPQSEAVQTPEEKPVEAAGTKTADDAGAASDVRGDEPAVAATAPDANLTLLQKIFPNLVKASRLGEVFNLPDEEKTRLASGQFGIADVVEAAQSQEALDKFTGTKSKKPLTPAIAADYKRLFGYVPGIIDNLNKRLAKFVADKNISSKLIDGTVTEASDPTTWPNGKALNIVEVVDGKLQYNEDLLGQALLAAMQFLLHANYYQGRIDSDKEAADILGVDETYIATHRDLIDALNQGMSSYEINHGLADEIIRYWGFKIDLDADRGMAEGIAQSLAAEITNAMIAQKLILALPVKADLKKAKESVRYRASDDELGKLTEIRGFPSVIEHAVQINPEDRIHIGEAPTEFRETQLNNPTLKNTSQDMTAIKKASSVPHKLNMNMVKVLHQLGEAKFLDLFAYGSDLDKQPLNKNHRVILKGRNQTLLSGFQSLLQLAQGVVNQAGEEGDPSSVPVFFEHVINRLGRLQMLGANNVQSSKVMREGVLSTSSTLDLTDENGKDFSRYGLALGQAMGIKVHNMDRDTAISKVREKLDGDLAGVVEYFANWLKSDTPLNLNKPTIDRMRELFNDGDKSEPVPMAAFHALLDYARYQNAKADNKQGSFETQLYVEADGVANGIFNAMMLATAGMFTGKWIRSIARGGLFLNLGKMTMNEFFPNQGQQTDLYKEGISNIYTHLKAFSRNAFKGKTQLLDHQRKLDKIMSMLLSSNITVQPNGDLEFQRGIAKNPMTITLYGSGAKGIAGNIAGEMMAEVYKRFSDAAQKRAADKNLGIAEAMFGDLATPDVSAKQLYEEFGEAIKQLTTMRLLKGKDKFTGEDSYYLKNMLTQDDEGSDRTPLDFTFTQNQIDTLRLNVERMFVNPLRASIADTVGGSVMATMKGVQVATQIQSVFAKFRFQQGIETRIAGKPKGQFTSINDERAEQAKLAPLGLTIRTKDQAFSPTKNARVPLKKADFGRGFDDSFETSANIYGPTDAGVGAQPQLVIGMGDGSMIQHLLNRLSLFRGGTYIYDGVHMPLDQIEIGSQQVNEAAFDAATQNNPARAVHNAFGEFLKNLSMANMPQEMRDELSKALGGENLSDQEMVIAFKQIDAFLKEQADQIDARHAVLRRVKLSMDQMAAVGEGYHREGDIDLSELSSEEAAQVLNEAYAEELAAIRGAEEAPTTDVVHEAVEQIGLADRDTGVKIVTANSLTRMMGKLNLDTFQGMGEVIGQIIASGRLKGWRIIQGTMDEMARYAERTGGMKLPVESAINGKIKGFIIPDDKRMYLATAETETLIHELLHVGSLTQVRDFYENGKATPEVREAITRLEGLMGEFLALGEEANPNFETYQAWLNATSEIKQGLARSDNLGKAVALNEFMAWSLSNQKLVELGKATEIKNPLLRLAKQAIDAIKQLIWGKNIRLKVGSDLYSNVLFNTSVIVASTPTTATLTDGLTMFHRVGDVVSDERLTKLEDVFQRLIVANIGPVSYNQSQRKLEAHEAGLLASDAAAVFQANGFAMGANETSTFKMVVSALATQAYIDPNAMDAVQDLFKQVLEVATPENFMKDPNSQDPNDIVLGQQRYNAIVGNFGKSVDALGRSTLLSSFLALAMVNEDFRKVLQRIKPPESESLPNNSLDNVLDNIGQHLMETLSTLMSGRDTAAPNVKDALDALTDRIIETAQEKKNLLDALAPVGKVVDASNSFIVRGVKAVSDKGVAASKKLLESSNTRATKFLGEMGRLTFSMINQENADDYQLGVMSILNESKAPQFLSELMNELTGRTSENAPIFDMVKLVRAMIQQLRQQYRDNLPAIFAKKFKQKMSKENWTTLFHSLGKTDLASLIDGNLTKADILKLLNGGPALSAKISTVEATIRSLDPTFAPDIERKTRELATYMMTGKIPANLLSNPYAISRLWSEGLVTKNRAAPTQQLVDQIDQLATLYALDIMPAQLRQDTQALLKDESEGMEFILSYMKGRRETELDKVRGNGAALANYYKGFLPSHQTDGTSLVVADDRDMETLKIRGYTRVGDYVGSDAEPNKAKRGYYFSPVSGRSLYQQGVLQNVQATAAGVDARTGLTNYVTTGGTISDQETVATIEKRLLSNNGTNAEGLIPVRDVDGKVVAFERSLDPAKAVMLERNTNLADSVAQWHGRQVEEAYATYYNQALVRKLKDHWDEGQKINNGKNRASEYVNLFGKITDPVLRDSLSLMNAQTKEYIESQFGKDEFWVRKDMINDVMGYRRASLTDFFNDTGRWSPETRAAFVKVARGVFGDNAYRYMARAEKLLQNVVADARVTIVLKSIIVPMANLASNFFQLLSRGVPIADIVRGMPRKTAEIDSYVRSRVRKLELEAELAALDGDPSKSRAVQAEITSIEDAHRRLSIWPLIQAGEFTSISDTGMTHDEVMLAEGKLSEYLEKLAGQLPEGLKTIGRYGIVAKDTSLYKGLQRSVEYGDFLGKAVLYDHLTKKKAFTKAEALANVGEEFVNYDRLAGRSRDYLESIGLMWFWNFKIRSTKIALNLIRNNPLHALLAMAVPGLAGLDFIGSPMYDNAASIITGGRSGWSLGPNMGVHAYGLNPWYNLVT